MGKVAHRANQAERAAFFITNNEGAIQDMRETPIATLKLVFFHPKRIGRAKLVPQSLRNTRLIHHVNAGDLFLGAESSRAVVVSEQNIERVVAPDVVRGNFPFPDDVVGGASGKFESF